MAKKLSTLFLMILMMAVLVPGPVHAKKMMIKLQSQFPDALPVIGESFIRFIENVQVMSGGEVNIKFYAPGKLVPPAGVLDAVSKNVVNAGFSSTAYWAGKIPASSIFLNVPFGPDATERVGWLMQGNGLKLWQEMYDTNGYNVKVLPIVLIPPESGGWFAKPIGSVDDFKGLAVRYGGYAGDVLKKYGASVSFMPMGDVFPALEKGLLDACEFSYPGLDAALGFSKVIKYNYFPGWHQPASTGELLINKDFWENKLNDQQRAIIETAVQANILWTLARGMATQADVLRDNAENKGVKNMTWPPEMIKAFEKGWKEVAAEYSAKDPFFKKVWEDLSAFRAKNVLWMEKGYLPTNCGAAD